MLQVHGCLLTSRVLAMHSDCLGWGFVFATSAQMAAHWPHHFAQYIFLKLVRFYSAFLATGEGEILRSVQALRNDMFFGKRLPG